MFVAEKSDAGDGVQVHGVQITHEFGQIGNRSPIMRRKRMIERYAQRTVAVLDVEYHGVSADFLPMLNDLDPFGAARHRTRQINRADLFVFSHRNRVFDDGLRFDRGNQQRLALFHV